MMFNNDSSHPMVQWEGDFLRWRRLCINVLKEAKDLAGSGGKAVAPRKISYYLVV